MKKGIFYLCMLLLCYFDGNAQKFSAGVLAGFTQNYEFTKYYTSYKPTNLEKSVNNGLNPSFGIYGQYEMTKKSSLALQVKYMRIIQQYFQDSVGVPVFKPTNAGYQCLNIASYYNFDINSKWSISIGAYNTMILFHGRDRADPPRNLFATSINVYSNSYGALGKVERRWNRVSVEGGFMYPFKPISKSRTILFYFPTAFLQLKYRLLPVNHNFSTRFKSSAPSVSPFFMGH